MKKLMLLGLISAFADCSAMDDSRRQFAGIDSSLHERLPLGINKLPSSASIVDDLQHPSRLHCIVFSEGSQLDRDILDRLRRTDKDINLILQDKGDSFRLGEDYFRQLFGFRWLSIGQKVVSVSIPDGVVELCERCFYGYQSLTRVTFGKNSSLRCIGGAAFRICSLTEIFIPDGVEEICDSCFFFCRALSRVTFGADSGLKHIGSSAFYWTGLHEISIPDSVEEIGDLCFYFCKSLSCVKFGDNPSLKDISNHLFGGSGLREIHMPDSVEEIGDECFSECKSLSCVTFGEKSCLKCIGQKVFYGSGLTKVCASESKQKLIEQSLAGTKLSGMVKFIDPQQASKTPSNQQ